jgi:hypothetical protein
MRRREFGISAPILWNCSDRKEFVVRRDAVAVADLPKIRAKSPRFNNAP